MSIQSVTFIDQTNNESVKNAVLLFTNHYKDKNFLTAVRNHRFFFRPHVTGNKVANKILNDEAQITLAIRNCLDEECPANASTTAGKKTIHWHSHALQEDRSLENRVTTLMHEYIHTLGYTHMGNKRNWFNERTAPYKVADMFVSFLKTNGKLL